MKNKIFQMRMSEETRKQLDRLKQVYQASASSVISMLISKETREVEKE